MKGFLKILAFIFIGLALHTWGSYNLRTGETYFLLLNIKTNIGETGNWQAVFIQGILGLILWVMSKERPNNEIIAEGRIRNGMEYFKEFLEASTSDIKTTSNAAKITVPYLELTDKINPDICAQQILDETSLPVGRETLKNALKWCLESKDIHSAFNMSKQEYKQLVLTHYLLLSRFLQGVGQVPLGSREYFSKCEGKKEAELQALKQVENKFQTLAKRERYQLFAEIEYYFPFPAGEEIASFGMELINRAAKLGRYYLPENSVEAAEHILRMIGLDLYRQFFSMLEEDTALMSDEKIRFHLSLLSSKLFHDKQFESIKFIFRHGRRFIRDPICRWRSSSI